MSALLELQERMAAAITGGPDFAAWEDYAVSTDRAVLALSLHANTISHARLIALEETFPRVREALGDGRFNRLSRDFVETGGGKRESLATIGRAFPDWLALSGEPRAYVRLARFDWAWLECFHAAEARAVTLDDLAGKENDEILALRLVCHLSLRVVTCPDAHMIVRPESTVSVQPISPVQATLLAIAAIPTSLDSLVTAALQIHPEADILSEIKPLIEAGAFAHGGTD
jgi:hypothetical protein